MTTPLQPTSLTTVTRGRDSAVAEWERLLAFVGEGLVAHVGLVADDHPVVIPAACAVDPDGSDAEGTLPVRGSVATGWARAAAGSTVCVMVTEADGLVLVRSRFRHSMYYRSGIVIGTARLRRVLAGARRAGRRRGHPCRRARRCPTPHGSLGSAP